ncbi:MAG: hypothetical protein R3354_00400 [Thiohalomonadales bacterium]|nr:hypothetical protein [Thiohalomonadales bacterium]
MEELVFTQKSLSKLVHIRRKMEKEFGCTYQISSNNQVVDLLRAAAYSSDDDIQKCFREFLQGLTQQQLKMITELGVTLPTEYVSNG